MTIREVVKSIATMVISVAFVAGGVVVAKKLAGSKPALPKSTQGGVATIFTKMVKNESIPVAVNATVAPVIESTCN